MRSVTLGLLCVACTLLSTGRLPAAERGTPNEAKAMLTKGIAHYQEVGREKALADFSSKKPPFRDRGLVVVCLSPDHTITAHGAFPQFVGQSSDNLKDAEGKPLGQALWAALAKLKASVINGSTPLRARQSRK